MRSAIALLGMLVAGCAGGEAPSQSGAAPAVPVRFAVLAPQPVEEHTEYVATLRSRRSVTLQPQVSG